MLFEIGELAPAKSAGLLSASNRTSLAKDLPMAPDDARRAVQNAVVVVEGQTTAFAPGRLTACRLTGSQATLDLPVQSAIKACLINVTIDRVAVQSPSAGIIAEWPASGR